MPMVEKHTVQYRQTSAAHRNYPRQFGWGIPRILRVLQRKQWVEDFRYVALDVQFINTLPVLVASRHARASGNPGEERHGDWMPAYAGMTLYWRRTYETDI